MTRDELVERLAEIECADVEVVTGHEKPCAACIKRFSGDYMDVIDAYVAAREREAALKAHREICRVQEWTAPFRLCMDGDWDCEVARRIKEGGNG